MTHVDATGRNGETAMTDIDVRPLNQQDIGQTEAATRALLDKVLGETETTFHQWAALNVTSATGPAEMEQLARQIVGALKIDASTAQTTLDELADRALITGNGPQVELTSAGEQFIQQIRADVAEITQRLYRDIPHEDLVTAHRVLATLTERANAELEPLPDA
jgi:DNA-binding MarR family transcriptional regulator